VTLNSTYIALRFQCVYSVRLCLILRGLSESEEASSLHAVETPMLDN
jgi:hypothetical protein